jgi:hypothetical protein
LSKSCACVSGQVKCGTSCIDPSSNRQYCGAKDGCVGAAACKATEACVDGSCKLLCATGQVACGDACIDPQTNPNYCGASDPCGTNPGSKCGANHVCVAGACQPVCPLICDGSCIDPQTNPAHCGKSSCTPITSCTACVAGECKTWVICGDGKTNCSGTCVDTAGNDNNNCGACGRTCSTQCQSGVCPPPVQD